MTYTNDQRFLARHIDNSDEWVLKVVSVQPRDAGVYECQVSTEPKISLAYRLTVVSKYRKERVDSIENTRLSTVNREQSIEFTR